MDSIWSLINTTAKDNSYSIALCSQGQYEVDEGLIFSLPCRTENGIINVIEDVQHNKFGQQKLWETLDELRKERNAVKASGLI